MQKHFVTGITLCIFLAVMTPRICSADVTKLHAVDQKALSEVLRFKSISSATNLPPAIFSLCTDGNGRLAEPGQKWEATDAITDEKLPRKRLIWAVTDGSYFIVHYERGGIGHSFHFLVAKLTVGQSKPSFVWRGVGDQLKDYKAFVNALHGGKLDDSLDYAH